VPADPLFDLVAAFNRGSLDIPEGFLTPNTTYTLNTRPYEELLGASPEDPLIRLLARGAAGYRTAATALQYALQHPVVTIKDRLGDQRASSTAVLKVDGVLRGSSAAFTGYFTLQLITKNDRLASVDVSCALEDLELIREARKR